MRELDLDKPCEDIDYQLVPVFVDDVQTWQVRLLRAPFDAVTIRYRNVEIDGKKEQLNFNFEVVEGDRTVDDVELQEFAADVLEDIIEKAIKEGWLGTREQDDDGNQSTADDSTESAD